MLPLFRFPLAAFTLACAVALSQAARLEAAGPAPKVFVNAKVTNITPLFTSVKPGYPLVPAGVLVKFSHDQATWNSTVNSSTTVVGAIKVNATITITLTPAGNNLASKVVVK